MCGEEIIGAVAGSLASAAVSTGASVATNAITSKQTAKAMKNAVPDVSKVTQTPAQPAPVRKQDTGAIVKIGGIDDAIGNGAATKRKSAGGTSLGSLGAYTAL